MGLSVGHIILVMVAVLVLFGAGRLPKLMEDLAKGIKAFKKGMQDEEHDSSKQKAITQTPSNHRK
jgi:sec-independent protein translocase protein TatA